MRLVIARCSVEYIGRLTAYLPMAPRLLLVKADGSVSIHADDRAYKPLNWMSPPCTLREEPGRWTVTNRTGEQLVITIGETWHDSRHTLGIDPGLKKDGVEAELQRLLAARPDTLGGGYRLVRREHPTAIGPVDLLCRDDSSVPVEVHVDGPGGRSAGPAASAVTAAGGRYVAVEIKRHASIDAVEQLTRYLDMLNRDPVLSPVRGVLAAQTIARQARTLAEDRGIRCVVVDYDALRELPAQDMTLF